MKIKCVDGIIREFIPAEKPMNRRIIAVDPAYCLHCRKTFNSSPSVEQKETWREHICSSGIKSTPEKQ